MLGRGLAVGLIAGVVSGFSRVHWLGPLDVVVNSIGAWLLVPFLVGAYTATWRAAASAGVLASVGQLVAFYVVTGAYGIGTTVALAGAWTACAVGGGSTAGVAGRACGAWRRHPRTVKLR